MPRAIRDFALTVAVAFAICAALPAAIFHPQPADAAQGRNWHQPHADALGTSAVDRQGVTVAPQELWRLKFERIVSDIVVWDDALFVAVTEGKKNYLLALNAADGSEIARGSLRNAEHYWLGVWQNSVAVQTPEFFRSYSLQGSKFKAGKTLRGAFSMHSLLAEDVAIVAQVDGPNLILDAPRGKELTSVRAGRGTPAFWNNQLALADLRTDNGWYGRRLALDLYDVVIDGRKSSANQSSLLTSGSPRKSRGQKESDDVFVIGIPREMNPTVWFVKSPLPLGTISGRRADSALMPGRSVSPIANRPAIWREQIIGFDYDDRLVAMNAEGAAAGVVSKEDLPVGAMRGPLSLASDCLYLGNWAVDLESREILWVDEQIQPLGPLVPYADHAFVYRSANHELVACGGGTGNGLAVAANADAADVEQATVMAAAMGPEFDAHATKRQELNEVIWSMFEKQFAAYLDARAMDDCRRLLQEAAEWHLPAERGRALSVQMAGKRRVSKGNFEKTLERLQSGEKKARGDVVKEFLSAAESCRANDQPLAASVLLAEADRLDPRHPDVRMAANSLIPAAFPFSGHRDAIDLWLEWAQELMPAGAEFIAGDHPLWKRTRGKIWARDTLGLRTENIILLIRSEDPKIVGSCLRNAEGTVRTLNYLLRKELPELERARLQVRVFANRREYLKEPNGEGFTAMPWSAGYYSPVDRISRFYIPDLNDPFNGQGHMFQKTLVHEITHQFLSQRWLPERTVVFGPIDRPGFWIVEGFARFIEDQLMELGQPRMGFSDPRAASLDYTACIADKSYFIPPQKLIEYSKVDFNQIKDVEHEPIQLKNSLNQRVPTTRSTFYEASGSLVFFLLNRRGEEGRAALIEYMRNYYLGRLSQPGWEALGFESAEQLEEQFLAFLQTVHAR